MVMVRPEAAGGTVESKHLNGFLKNGNEKFIVIEREEYLLSSPVRFIRR